MKRHYFLKILLIVAVGLLLWFWFCLPDHLFSQPYSYVLKDSNGRLIDASIAKDGQWRFPVQEEVPEKFIQCITTFEDRRFFSHPGIDLAAITRATLRNMKAGSVVQGASTITMQVIRLSRNRERSWRQKIIESIQALRLEWRYSKDEIMALYAAHAPFGGNVIGLEAASWRYYGRDAQKLSWGEMATLAVLPNAPSLVHPGKNRSVLLQKRNHLLQALVSRHILDSSECVLAMQESLPGKPLPLPQLTPHLLQRFKTDGKEQHWPSLLRTTLDGDLQQRVNEIVNRHHQILKGNHINNACALVLEVETGNVLAYVGNVDEYGNPEMQSAVDVIKAPRSPGSAMKPILYAAAFSEGSLLPQMLLPDVPTRIGGYTPQNFDRRYDGAVPASAALSRSLNIPAVKVLQKYKYARFYDMLKKLGVTTLNQPADHYGLSLILGGCEVTLWDLAGVYAGMARVLNHSKQNKGLAMQKDFFPPSYFKKKEEEKQPEQPVSGLDATSIWFTFEAMEEVMRPGEEGLWQQFTSSKRIAWKTGTSFGFRDAWAIGISPKYVVGVWTGNTAGEGRPGLIGVQASAPIMFDIFRLLPQTKWFSNPTQHFAFEPVCAQSGFRAGPDCPDADTVMVPANAYKSPLCPYHQVIHLDPSGNYRVTEDCVSPEKMLHESWFVLPPTMEWYYRKTHHDYKPLPAYLPGCGASDTSPLDMVYPTSFAKIYVPLEADGKRGKTIFMASHRDPSQKIYWHLDGEFMGTTTRFHQMAFAPPPGNHTITIVDESGESLSRQFEIINVEK